MGRSAPKRFSLSKAIADWVGSQPDRRASRAQIEAHFDRRPQDQIRSATGTARRNGWLQPLGNATYQRTDRPTSHYLRADRVTVSDTAGMDGPAGERKWPALLDGQRFEDDSRSLAQPRRVLLRYDRPQTRSLYGCAAAMCARV